MSGHYVLTFLSNCWSLLNVFGLCLTTQIIFNSSHFFATSVLLVGTRFPFSSWVGCVAKSGCVCLYVDECFDCTVNCIESLLLIWLVNISRFISPWDFSSSFCSATFGSILAIAATTSVCSCTLSVCTQIVFPLLTWSCLDLDLCFGVLCFVFSLYAAIFPSNSTEKKC